VQVTPQQVMSLLDNLYYRFDKLTERYMVRLSLARVCV
jgi:hypothetical protein